ncbi:MAG: IS4 family transposase [Gemmataceae bacterium]|nr:IS4 family transposase [Gemmataceae bacterium]
MTRQGCCSVPAQDALDILDRLEGLSKVIAPEIMEQALLETGRDKQRACRLSHRVMLWVVLAMGLLTHLPIRQVFKHARRRRAGEKTPSRSNLCEARQRLGVEPVRRVFDLVVRPLATPQTPGAFYKGLRPMGIDGTVQDVPDTPANAERFGRSSGGRGDGAFPQVRKVSLVELGTHVEVAMAIGGWHDSEQKLVSQLWDKIPADALLIEDRGFFSYEHWKKLHLRVKLLVRVKNNMILKPIQRLPDGSYLAKIYPSSYARDKDRDGILVRVIEYTLDDPQRTGDGEKHLLLTNLFDHETYPALELACQYHERWEEELVFDEQKTHQDPRRPGKPAQLRSQTPEGVEQELYALSLGHFVVRALMLEAAKQENLDVDRLSFTGCLRILQARLPECDSSTPMSLDQWYRLLLEEMVQERIEPRRNRVNPRVIKRKMSKWLKKRPEHRHRPPLKKTFVETVVIT